MTVTIAPDRHKSSPLVELTRHFRWCAILVNNGVFGEFYAFVEGGHDLALCLDGGLRNHDGERKI